MISFDTHDDFREFQFTWHLYSSPIFGPTISKVQYSGPPNWKKTQQPSPRNVKPPDVKREHKVHVYSYSYCFVYCRQSSHYGLRHESRRITSARSAQQSGNGAPKTNILAVHGL